jgi:hypothetical protein
MPETNHAIYPISETAVRQAASYRDRARTDAECMALAVLAGDQTAAAALADEIVAKVVSGETAGNGGAAAGSTAAR